MFLFVDGTVSRRLLSLELSKNPCDGDWENCSNLDHFFSILFLTKVIFLFDIYFPEHSGVFRVISVSIIISFVFLLSIAFVESCKPLEYVQSPSQFVRNIFFFEFSRTNRRINLGSV